MNQGAAEPNPIARPPNIAHIQAFLDSSCNPQAIRISIIKSAIPFNNVKRAIIVVWKINARISTGNAISNSTVFRVREWEPTGRFQLVGSW